MCILRKWKFNKTIYYIILIYSRDLHPLLKAEYRCERDKVIIFKCDEEKIIRSKYQRFSQIYQLFFFNRKQVAEAVFLIPQTFHWEMS